MIIKLILICLSNSFFNFFIKMKNEKRTESVYPKCHFLFFINWNMKLEIKLWLFRFEWFSDFKNSWTLKWKFEVCFSFFILIWKTENQIYLNKYLMKPVTILLAQSWKSIKESNSSMIKHQIFVNKYLPVQNPQNKH